MTELSPQARILFEAGRQALQPAMADRERVFAALSARVGGIVGGGGTTGAPPAGGLSWPMLATLALGFAVAAAGLYRVPRASAPERTAPAALTASALVSPPSTQAPRPPSLSPEAPAPAADSVRSVTSAPPPGGARPSATVQSSDGLAEEVAILADAERHLNAREYQSALDLLEEHRRRFPNGTLAEERRAARVQALCGLGRVTEAQQALDHLTRLAPNSPHAARAREACAPQN